MHSMHHQNTYNIQCCYVNDTNKFQIVRISNNQSRWFERVVLPYARITFEASPDNYLEVYSISQICSILEDKISCNRLISE